MNMNIDTFETEAEVKYMQDRGMQRVSVSELTIMLRDLGYRLKNDFNYVNSSNERTYKAKSVQIIDNTTELSFANVDANRVNLPALQEVRANYFVYHRGRIWEV